MAQRRMFSKDITASDLFVDMPASTQLLYFQLGMEADDEGFIGNAKMLSRAYGANNDDLKLLQAKGFVIMFESGVTVVKDWKINNQIRKDRFKPTIYQAEKSLLNLDINGSYQLGDTLATKWQPNDNQLGDTLATQYSIGKESIGKESIEYIVEQSPTEYLFPDWLEEKYVEQVKKGNPKNFDYRIPIAYLNQKMNSNYKFVKTNTDLVKARLKDSYTLEDFKAVIDKKCSEWGNSDMAKYLRPSTLFNASKFESYLNQPEASNGDYYQKQQGQRFSQAELDELKKPDPKYGF
ncbi:conserved phage C-terminal domain-containing protein [Streptococcus dysgalactiae]|uniref:conserved phage C-terminal domain-containing protein n=1 Tax=Streptococcus dysgalactiae TaxID=1334 RepID=UPI001CF3BB6B|nr:conserved phage C-terminal domain-containing protein [Streptococcus dysgalactiae]MCB2828920.1 conserved phage C-terminal domain-containing protein [Streptococcus dysgalactiae subsp. dysgalactiae]MCB2842789.1 conserved phage C-terminal domain-containing protein [Streptococcus dysgalactiae subsp. dysgalactiae]MCB2849981.1 conserved phage C-terminal domain-containing protein [Streptococcus dysgalactiae subsp. dysgalactiae]